VFRVGATQESVAVPVVPTGLPPPEDEEEPDEELDVEPLEVVEVVVDVVEVELEVDDAVLLVELEPSFGVV